MCHDSYLETRDSSHCRGKVKFLLSQVKSKGKVMPLLIGEWWMQQHLYLVPAVSLAAAERMAGSDVPGSPLGLQYFAKFLIL